LDYRATVALNTTSSDKAQKHLYEEHLAAELFLSADNPQYFITP
jgi:hypothetical protein